MTIDLRDTPFSITGGTVARTLNQRFSEHIDVSEFRNLHTGSGTFGSGLGDNSPCFQAAWNKAFGSVSAPHGYDNRHLNRPIRIPSGNFKCDTPILATRVVGGHIYGPGAGVARLFLGAEPVGGSTITPTLHFNGAVGLTAERFEVGSGGGGGVFTGLNSCAMLLDWDGVSGTSGGGTGGGGLSRNTFNSMEFGAGEYGVIIARSDFEGHNTMFLNCNIGGAATSMGIDIRGSAAFCTGMFGGGFAYHGNGGVRCQGGSFNAHGASVAGNSVDYIMESPYTMNLTGFRTESTQLLRMEDGLVTINAFTNAGGNDIIEVNDGILTLEASIVGQSSIAQPRLFGTGGAVRCSGCTVGAAAAVFFEDYDGDYTTFNPDGLGP